MCVCVLLVACIVFPNALWLYCLIKQDYWINLNLYLTGYTWLDIHYCFCVFSDHSLCACTAACMIIILKHLLVFVDIVACTAACMIITLKHLLVFVDICWYLLVFVPVFKLIVIYIYTIIVSCNLYFIYKWIILFFWE